MTKEALRLVSRTDATQYHVRPMSMKNLIENVKNALQNRMRNPLGISFAFAWVTLNWRVLVHLFLSELPAAERIKAVEGLGLGFSDTVLYPAFFAVLYLLGIHWLTLCVQDAQAKPIRLRREKMLKESEDYRVSQAKSEERVEEIRARISLVQKRQEVEFEKEKKELDEHLQERLERLAERERKLEELGRELDKRSAAVEEKEDQLSSWESDLKRVSPN